MSDQTEDILSNDLGGVSLKLPLLPPDEYTLTVKKVEITESREKKTKMVKVSMATREPAKDTSGNPINAGFPVFDQWSITPTEKYTQDAINRRLKTFRVASVGKDTGGFYPLAQYEGATVRVKIAVDQAKDGFEERNSVKYVLPPKQA